MDIGELKSKKIAELYTIAKDLKITGYSDLRKQELIYKILETQTEKDGVALRKRRTGCSSGRIWFFAVSRL